MVTHRWSGRWRVFWNKNSEAPNVWSIDQGEVSTEVKVQTVTIQCAGRTHVNPQADNTTEPRGWIEGVGEVRIYDDIACLIMGPGLHVNTGSFDRLTDQQVN